MQIFKLIDRRNCSSAGRQRVFLLLSLLLIVASNIYGQRKSYNFNHAWKLHVGQVEGAEFSEFDDSSWEDISLPYAWNQSEAFKKDIKDLSTGIAWYRKEFILPEGKSPVKVFLEFEGVRQMGEVYVNGVFVGRSENGVMAFGLDVSDLLEAYPAVNVIAVKTDNSWDYREKLTGQRFQWNDRNFNANYGGIPKNVFLHVISSEIFQTLPLYSSLGTTGTYVYASNFDIEQKKALINVESQVRNESGKAVDVHLKVEVMDMEGKCLGSLTSEKYSLSPNGMTELYAADTLRNLNFWSWGYGYLYDIYSELYIDGHMVDQVVIRTGFRKTAFSDGMIYLNDRVIMMKGYAQRTSNEWPSVGMSVPAWLSDYSNSLIIEGNGNMVRWMHVTPWKQDVQSCDRVGLIHAMPAGDAEGDVHGRRWQQRKELMRDAIIYNRNNPSIIFYECGNENISEEHMAEMKAIRDKYDPFGGRAIGSREMLDSDIAEYGGEMLYINKSADMPVWAMEYSRDEGLRKYWDEFTPPYHKDGDGPLYKGKDASEYNRNQDSHAIEDVVRWYDYWEMRPGTGKRVSSGGANIIWTDSNTHHRGEENYRRSGEADAMRIPKENYWAHKVIWDGWVDTDTFRIHILGHWNYAEDVVKDVTVISTAEDVELYNNGRFLGKGERSSGFLFTFKDVKYEEGSIVAKGYVDGIEVCQTEKQTSGKPSRLKLSLIQRPGGMLADGSDLALVQVEVLDTQGRRCPDAMNMVHFEVEGPGEFVGGIAQGPGNYIGSESLPVECGINRVFIRSAKKAGKITVRASSDGLKKSSLEILTRQTDISPLSDVMPYDKLDSYLGKGQTPKTPSYKVSRIPLKIVSARSLVHQADIALSYDDNELTRWENDGILKTAVVDYQLERESMINQVVIKLDNWRRKSYPLTIFVDENKVYEGETPRSLGYVTCNFTPAFGSKVRIQLSGFAVDDEAFNIVELSEENKKQKGEVDSNKQVSGKLSIIEIEFYEAANRL